jgi:hypothetical protein
MSEKSDAFFFDPLDPSFVRVIAVITLDLLLRADVVRAREDLELSDPTEYHRRQYIRAVFAQLEGATFGLKQLAIPSKESLISSAELALLKGESYRLNDTGEAVVGNARLTLPSDMRFAFRMYAKSVGIAYDLPVNEPGWTALIRARKVRDRLMHPRSPNDLETTDEEIGDATDAAEWFQKQYRKLQDLMMDQISRNQGMNEEEVAAFREERERILREQIVKHEARRHDAV